MPRQDAGEPYFRISIGEAAEMYGDDNVAFIDVRRPDEYAEGHIKDAIFIPVDDVLARIDELPEDKKLLYEVGILGLLNGLFGVDEKQWGAIAAEMDPSGHVRRFVVREPWKGVFTEVDS